MKANGGSVAVLIASIWSGMVHLGLGVLGTFVLKRFPTSFSVGFLLGVLVVIANQNLLLFATFLKFSQGNQRTNDVFAVVGFSVFCVMSLMSLLLFHFKHEVVVAPSEAGKGEEGLECSSVLLKPTWHELKLSGVSITNCPSLACQFWSTSIRVDNPRRTTRTERPRREHQYMGMTLGSCGAESVLTRVLRLDCQVGWPSWKPPVLAVVEGRPSESS
eukprot:scaffold1717_cov117-Cylindrotheca_fusiformis.AAC.8